MQLLDDDMDELFRNAASDYPLNTGSGDWEAMRNKLQQADNNQQGTAIHRNKGRWWLRPRFLVIITAILSIVAVGVLFNGARKDTGKGFIDLHRQEQGAERSTQLTAGDSEKARTSFTTAEENNGTNTSTVTKTPGADPTAAATVSTGKTETPDQGLPARSITPVNKPAQADEQASPVPMNDKAEDARVVTPGTDNLLAGKPAAGATGEKKKAAYQKKTVQKPVHLPDRKQFNDAYNHQVNGNNITNDGDDHLNTNERVAAAQKRQQITTAVAGNKDHSVKGNSEQSIVNSENGNITSRASATTGIPTSSYPAARSGVTAVSIPLSIDRIHSTADTYAAPATDIRHINRSVQPADSAFTLSEVAPSPQGKQEPAFLKKGLYYGLVFSPDLTTVKMQRTSDVGYNVGLLAGYRFGKKLSLETGVLYERKYYYSTGQYFNKTKTPWPQDMTVLNVDGWCNMYEIPLNVRFNFATGKKSSWYVNGGMSSYIMKRQKYDYTYEYYGQTETRNWTYKKTMADWFSIVHLGVGYERPVGVLGILRVEPYVKIPASGVGIGDLPVTSVGINIGLTRPLRLK